MTFRNVLRRSAAFLMLSALLGGSPVSIGSSPSAHVAAAVVAYPGD